MLWKIIICCIVILQSGIQQIAMHWLVWNVSSLHPLTRAVVSTTSIASDRKKSSKGFSLWPCKRVLNRRCTYFGSVLVIMCVLPLYFHIIYQIYTHIPNTWEWNKTGKMPYLLVPSLNVRNDGLNTFVQHISHLLTICVSELCPSYQTQNLPKVDCF